MSFAPGFHSRTSSKSAFAAAINSSEEKRKPPPPFSLRLTWEERERLKRDAGKMALGAYVRSKLFGKDTSKRRTSRKKDIDQEAVARLLGMISKTKIPNNLNQIAKAANTGLLPIDDDIKSDLTEACAHVAQIRQMLMAALDFRETE